jgi:hypothetical protein
MPTTDQIIQIVGYIALALTAASMVMRSIVKLRRYMLIGCSLYIIYAVFIKAYPVAFLNGFIVMTCIYYFIRMHMEKEYFKIIEVAHTNNYLRTFLEINRKEIKKTFPNFFHHIPERGIGFFILRNLNVASVLLGTEKEPGTLFIDLDFAVPEYRDFKLGRYIFTENQAFFQKNGYQKICSIPHSSAFNRYLRKMGFTEETEDGKKIFVKILSEAAPA